jgi:hypothetical protein
MTIELWAVVVSGDPVVYRNESVAHACAKEFFNDARVVRLVESDDAYAERLRDLLQRAIDDYDECGELLTGTLIRARAALAKNPNPSGHQYSEASDLQRAEASGPVGLGPVEVLTGRCPQCCAPPGYSGFVRAPGGKQHEWVPCVDAFHAPSSGASTGEKQ